MKKEGKYRIYLEDESHLTTLGSLRFSLRQVAAAIVVAIVVSILLGAVIVMLTPLHTLLPGYMKKSERAASIENLMRLDSLQTAFDVNKKYLDNLFRITVGEATSEGTEQHDMDDISPDSILPASPREMMFVDRMQEQEKYNLSVLAPLAADGMTFARPASNAAFQNSTRGERRCGVIMGSGEPATSPADGTVLAAFFSPAEKGYVVIIQHGRGFVSRLSHLPQPIVAAGDPVDINQAISLPVKGATRQNNIIYIEMWHNGLSLKPYDFISGRNGV